MNLVKLKQKIAEKGVKMDDLAKIVEVDRSSLYRKFNNFEKITIGEAKKLQVALCLTPEEATEIFLQ